MHEQQSQQGKRKGEYVLSTFWFDKESQVIYM